LAFAKAISSCRVDAGTFRVDDQSRGKNGHDRDRNECLRIETELRIEMLTDHERALRRGKQRVAVGLRLGDNLRAEVLCGAGPVLDNHRLAPFERELVSNDARQSIGRGTRRKRHDDLDHSAGIDLRRCARATQHGRQRHPKMQLSHGFPLRGRSVPRSAYRKRAGRVLWGRRGLF
jgi:hypothetical protein